MSWTTDFGFRDVPIADKARRVGEVFTSVAFRYDLMNDLMSGGCTASGRPSPWPWHGPGAVSGCSISPAVPVT